MSQQIRRTDRIASDAQIMQLLESAEYGVLSTVDGANQPYGVPVSFVLLDDKLYIHSALEGHKLDNIALNPQVSFCVVGKTELLPDKFAMKYESVIVSGRASLLMGEAKEAPLQALLAKYSPGHPESGDRYLQKLVHKTAVIALSMELVTGKARS